ncbi:MAG: helix-turn-helix domain-containing protein [Saprospiraceae bacterium]
MIKPIKNKKQYESYLEKAYTLMQLDLRPNTQESDELELITILIESYEKEHYTIAPPHPIEAILFRLDQLGMKKSQLKEVLGHRSRINEVLSGKRKLSLTMIRNLNTALHIPAEILIQEYS